MGSSMWVISRVAIVLTQIRGLIIPLITTHEPPSRGFEGSQGSFKGYYKGCFKGSIGVQGFEVWGFRVI